MEAEIVDGILHQCDTRGAGLEHAALVFAGEGWHLGVLGSVASRLVERFCRPVFVLSHALSDEGAPRLTGSGRSVPAFHLLEALESMPELFSKFGGHRQAAGLTMAPSDLDVFRQRFSEVASQRLQTADLRPQLSVDAETSFSELSDDCVQQVLSLGPFGCGNPSPLLLVQKTEVAGPPKVLKEGKHFSVPLRKDGKVFYAKAWNFGDRAGFFAPGTKLDGLFQLEGDPGSKKRGYRSWCLTLKDVRHADA